ncbi:MAG: hypothetical protein TR69_WS6001000056 [candidate division WS6 bacterium OLB20]|uniref:Uncharacterized protein n=1 Tax=candidate division WS6 bacterium OLB20 TaxID=1617426 RepID=A0A136M129_9BACT|nr:MAG: hypothetical protein TR69_WS6001000056 [candidate division WS6 bacterium OLB20]
MTSEHTTKPRLSTIAKILLLTLPPTLSLIQHLDPFGLNPNPFVIIFAHWLLWTGFYYICAIVIWKLISSRPPQVGSAGTDDESGHQEDTTQTDGFNAWYEMKRGFFIYWGFFFGALVTGITVLIVASILSATFLWRLNVEWEGYQEYRQLQQTDRGR